ncbi:cytochrome P450 [Kibdelosporangium philippinense]|uniref:Cytochrome P450 n=1 Tax=Kibdelosporangium philippinense TaxID=211113 RepID=A0ABS8ZSZ0_9PSEU|nr:cytochrome P450 [Kibdelosporangium philippinense]MCE7010704.1 cytochrome P450 [Kibdelosporangium philippinense]
MTDMSTIPAFPATRAPGCPFEPPAEFSELRDNDAITQASCPAGIDAWVVSRYEDVRNVLSTPSVSSRKAPSAHVTPGADLERPITPGNILQLDGKEHARLRRLLTPEFTVRRMEALRPYIQQLVEEHIDAMLAGPQPADLYQAFALPIPSLVICEMLGVPYEDREVIHEHSATLMAVDRDPAIGFAAYGQVQAYMTTLFETKLANPGDDLIGRMITRGRESGDQITAAEMVELAITLLIAGHETTANMIALSTAALLQQPEKLAELRDNPELAPTAVEEMLRYLSVVQFGLLRYATEDVQIGEQTVKAGEWLVAAIGSGNRDEQVYAEADSIDLARKAKTHLAFGFGIHQCLGQQLARIELQEVYARLFRRIPTMRLAIDADEISFKDNALVYGVHELPVTWEG